MAKGREHEDLCGYKRYQGGKISTSISKSIKKLFELENLLDVGGKKEGSIEENSQVSSLNEKP